MASFRHLGLGLALLMGGLSLQAADAIGEARLREHLYSETAFAPTGNVFSAAVRVKVECMGSRDSRQRLIMSVGNGYNHGFRLCLKPDPDGKTLHPFLEIGVGPRKRAWALEGAGGSVRPGYWRRVAAVWNGQVARLFVEGRVVAEAPYAGAYVHSPDRQAKTGVDGESYGIVSVPHILDRAAVWTRALSADEVAAFAPEAPFEPDTPRVSEALEGMRQGKVPTLAELDAWERLAHSPWMRMVLLRTRALSYLNAGDHSQAVRCCEAAIAQMRKVRGGPVEIADFRTRFTELALINGFAAAALDTVKADYEAARAAQASHLPYVVLRYLKTAERAGKAEMAAQLRQELLAMDLTCFPQLRAELGLPTTFTAAGEKGASVARTQPRQAFYVAPSGDDAGPGSRERPFRSARRARDAVRALKATQGLPTGGVAVCFRGGVYPMSETLVLTAADSGEPAKPVVWCAAENEVPIFEGGFRVPDLKSVTDANVLARLPAVARGRVKYADLRAAGYPDPGVLPQYGYYANRDVGAAERPPAIVELYQGQTWLTPARYPNSGWLTIAALGEGAASNTCVTTTLPDWEAWAKEPDLAATGFWNNFWADLTTAVTNVDVQARQFAVNLTTASRRQIRPRVGQTFFLFNALCALDAPGEWHYDRATGRLYVWPRTDIASNVFTIGRFADVFIDVKDAHDLRFEGLFLRHGRGTGVAFADVHDCVFAGNVVTGFGGMGLEACPVRNVTVEDNVFRTFGHGAMAIAGGDRKTLTHAGNVVANNEFADVERRRRTYAPHLHVAGVGTEVRSNHFHDSPSSAMRLEGNDFLIVSNLVENVLLESDDQGGLDIYFNASYFGNRYCWNTWKNIGRVSDTIPCGQAAVRFDGNISGQTVYGNRFVNCGTGQFGAIQSCGGRLHVIDNNLFVNCNKGMSISIYPTNFWFNTIRPTLIQPCLKDVCITNAPYATRYPGIADLLWTNQVNHLVRNITVGNTPLLVNPPADTVAYGNLHFPEVPDLAQLARETAWRPIPEEDETGPRPTPRFLQAQANDRAAVQ